MDITQYLPVSSNTRYDSQRQ